MQLCNPSASVLEHVGLRRLKSYRLVVDHKSLRELNTRSQLFYDSLTIGITSSSVSRGPRSYKNGRL